MPIGSLIVSHPIIQEEIAAFLGWGRTLASWTADQVIILNRMIESGLRQFYFHALAKNGLVHQWSFMRPVGTLTTTTPYATGTITVVAGVVTLAGGGAVWPAWAAQGELQVAVNVYPVSTRDSDAQLTLTDLSIAVAAGTTYSLGRPAYDLPSDFGGFNGPMTYRPGISTMYPTISITKESMIRAMKQRESLASRPRFIAIRPKAFTATVGQVQQAVFFPTPDGAYELSYPYKVIPGMIDGTNLYPLGGAQFGEAVLESCLAIAEERYNEGVTTHRQKYPICLAAAIAEDEQSFSPEFLGYNSDRSDRPDIGFDRFPGAVVHTYNGVAYYDS